MVTQNRKTQAAGSNTKAAKKKYCPRCQRDREPHLCALEHDLADVLGF